MNSSFFTPRRILAAIAIIALLLIFRECLKNRQDESASIDELNIRYDVAPAILNPYITLQGTDLFTCARIFQSLGDLDPKTLELVPVLIKSLPEKRQVESGPHAGQMAYDFEILPEATWENGTPVTAEDVRFSLQVIIHPLIESKAYMGFFKDLTDIDIDSANPKKFTVYFRQYYFMALEAINQFPILPRYVYDPGNALAKYTLPDLIDTSKRAMILQDQAMTNMATEFKSAKHISDPTGVSGSGPYKLVTLNDQGVILEKKQNWWGDKLAASRPILAAYPKKLVYKAVKNENVVENMMKNGELDIIANSLSPAKFMDMQKKDSLRSKYIFQTLPALQYNRWLLNLDNPKFKDLKVRMALAHLIDYDHFVKNIRMNMAVRTSSPILPSKDYYDKSLVPYDFNVDKAKQLLAEAGWTDTDGDGLIDKVVNGVKTKFSFNVLVPISAINQQYAESVIKTARLAGIEINSINTDLTEIIAKTRNGDYDSALLGTSLFPGLTDLTQRFHSKYLTPAGDNRAHYINPELDKVLEDIAKEEDVAKRKALYFQAQRIIHADLPEIIILAPFQPIVNSNRFEPMTTTNRPGYYEPWYKPKN